MPDSRHTTGLRERKKAKTRAAIMDHAMRLFREQGYAETTVDQIAEAAEVSPSTFFRYFPTKEDVVLTDDYDPMMIESFRTQPPESSPIQAIRAALRTGFAQMSDLTLARERERHLLIRDVPELRVAAIEVYARSMRLLSGLVAERVGRDPEDFAVRIFAGAMIGVAIAVIESVPQEPLADFLRLLDEGFAALEQGFPALIRPASADE